jgi:probable F420-dependent oxidoreductase
MPILLWCPEEYNASRVDLPGSPTAPRSRADKEARVLIGCHLPTTLAPAATKEGLVRFAQEAERRDIASLWVSDHVVIPRVTSGHRSGGAFPHPPDRPYLEPVTALTAAALCTTRPRLGSSVFILGHRHPVLMAKMLASIDALSDGRLIAGVGVGWWKEELEILGVPFAARGRHADEALRIFKELWTSENPVFAGEFFRFRDIGFAPKPVQKPHPPIWVGGASSGAFRRVAALGDGWHANARTPAQFREGLAQLWAAADAVGRPHGTIELSLRYGLHDDVLTQGAQSVIDDLAGFKRLGVRHVLIEFRRPELARMLELLDVVAGTIRPVVDGA